jgi:DNA-binding response OmpR family regulator
MSARLRVLVVDDDPDLAETIEDILSGWGHEVTVAHDGERAVALFRERTFDLCFMDVRLPGASGVESFLEIRRFRPEAKVMIMTGYSVDDELARAVGGGALGILHKPLEVADLLRTVDRAGGRGVVLVVDDDADFAESLRDALLAAGYSALVARDAGEARARLKDGSVDVMVLDLRLPGRSGLELCRDLARAEEGVPTIVVTAYPREEAVAIEALREHAVSDVLVKPVDVRALLRAIDGARGLARA